MKTLNNIFTIILSILLYCTIHDIKSIKYNNNLNKSYLLDIYAV